MPSCAQRVEQRLELPSLDDQARFLARTIHAPPAARSATRHHGERSAGAPPGSANRCTPRELACKARSNVLDRRSGVLRARRRRRGAHSIAGFGEVRRGKSRTGTHGRAGATGEGQLNLPRARSGARRGARPATRSRPRDRRSSPAACPAAGPAPALPDRWHASRKGESAGLPAAAGDAARRRPQPRERVGRFGLGGPPSCCGRFPPRRPCWCR